MNFSFRTILDIVERTWPYVVGAAAYFFSIYSVDRWLEGQGRVVFRYAAVVATIALFFFGCHEYAADHALATDITKAMIAIVAAGCVFYEQHRKGQRRPVAERWKRFVGIALGVAGTVVYFNGFKFGYPRYYNPWDQYHYYMGAKYFREMGYDGLYKCSVIAEDELGTISNDDAGAGLVGTFDLTREVRHPDKKVRNLGGDNLLIPVTDILAHPEECKSHFSLERWEKYKADVRFFRIASDKGYWEDMQKDHGFNPPPVWTILGHGFAELTCYQCSFMILTAPLTRVKKGVEAPLFGFAALTQLIRVTFTYNDDNYTVLTLVSLVLCFGLICAFAPRGSLSRLFGARSGSAIPVTGAALKREFAEGDEE
jgi:hypothetical protein